MLDFLLLIIINKRNDFANKLRSYATYLFKIMYGKEVEKKEHSSIDLLPVGSYIDFAG